MTSKNAKPIQNPPISTAADNDFSNDAPKSLPPDEGGEFASQTELLQPTQNPPEESFGEGEDAYGSSVWLNNKRITALFTTSTPKNVWVYILNVGWRKFEPSQNSANSAFAVLAGVAKSMARPVNIKVENNNITQMYLW